MTKYACSVEIEYYSTEETFKKNEECEIDLFEEQVALLKQIANAGITSIDELEFQEKHPDLYSFLFDHWCEVGDELCVEACEEEDAALSEEEEGIDYGMIPSASVTIEIPALCVTLKKEGGLF